MERKNLDNFLPCMLGPLIVFEKLVSYKKIAAEPCRIVFMVERENSVDSCR